MALALDTSNSQFALKDTAHILDKDTRTLFANDNLKYKKRKKANIPELHLLSYYGDITGPNELHLRNRCMKLMKLHHKNLGTSVSECKTESNTTSMLQSLFHPNNIEIMHISHYSSEFVVNVSNTPFLDEYKINDTQSNHYLVCAYQESDYQGFIEKYVTIGMTKSVSHANNRQLYEFYVDDFVQDLYKIFHNLSWYDQSFQLFESDLWYYIAQYTVDCILPVTYTRSSKDEIVLDDDIGSIHVFLSGELNLSLGSNDNDDSGDIKESDHMNNKEIDSTLETIVRTIVDIGGILHKNKKKVKTKLKSEYDKWKKQGFKIRGNITPLNMNELSKKVALQQQTRKQAYDLETINQLKYLYYKNPNFKLKSNISKTKMQSFKKFFSFGSLNNKKNKHGKAQTYAQNIDPRNIMLSQTDEVLSEAVVISRARTEPFHHKKRSKKKKKKNKKKKNNDHSYNIHIPSKVKATTSLPTFTEHNINSAQPESISKSSGYPNRKQIDNKNNHMTIAMLSNMAVYDTMDPNNEAQLQLVLPDTTIGGTQSADSVYTNMKRINPGKLTPLRKSQKGKSVDIQSNASNVANSPYSHNENVVMYIDYDQKNNKHTRQESNTIIQVKKNIRIAYRDYERDKGKIPNIDDIQHFLHYCKNTKHIKKATWTHCESVINDMKVNIDDTIFE